MDITPTTASTDLPRAQASAAHAAARTPGQATPLPEKSAIEPRVPTMIDIAAANTLAWMMNHLLRTIGANIEFVVQSESGEIVVHVLDKATGDLIRHIPAEALPDVAAVLAQTHGGLVEELA